MLIYGKKFFAFFVTVGWQSVGKLKFSKGEVIMAQQVSAAHEAHKLPHGFVAIPETLMVLDVAKLQKVMVPRMDSLRKAVGTSFAEKLSGFCVECLKDGKTANVTVVGRTIEENDQGEHSYLCLCPCGKDLETFVLCGSFLAMHPVASNSKQRQVRRVSNVAYAT